MYNTTHEKNTWCTTPQNTCTYTWHTTKHNTCTTQSKTQWVQMLEYHYYIMHIHSTTCPQHNMYNKHIIPHVNKYHIYNMYTVPLVHSTTCTTCAQHHMYTTPPTQSAHNATHTLHHLYNVYRMPHVHNTIWMTYTWYYLCIAPHAWHVHNTTYPQHHMNNHAPNTISTYHHM